MILTPTARRWRLSLAQEVGELAEALQEGLATMAEETVGRDYTFVSTPSYTGEELAAIDDRWQEGGFDEAEAMDFDGDYDDDGGMPDS